MLINTDTLKTVVNGLLMKINSKAVQSDWNQNNSTADSYIKNRTHWEESKERKLIRDIDFSNCYMVDWGQTKIGYLYEFIPISLKIGKKYNVVFDGTLYQCVAFRDNEFSNVVIGNGLFVADSNSDNGLPFAIGNYSNSYSDAYVIVADQETHSFSITDTEIIIHKLDYKYLDLPTNLATTDDVQEATNNKMDANNPVGAGSFSMNRKSGTIVGNYSHAEGYNTTASGSYSHAEGYNTTASGNYSHAEGNGTKASGNDSHTEGQNTVASGNQSHAEGYYTTASGDQSHVEGERTTASGGGSHAEGNYTTASGTSSHAEGGGTNATGDYSHAEGYTQYSNGNNASGKASHVEGINTTASGIASHAEGNGHASGNYSHAEGGGRAEGIYSHAEGSGQASGTASHAEGQGQASGDYSHVEGFNTIAAGKYSHVQGDHNIEDKDGKYAHIVGHGYYNTAVSPDIIHSNIHTLDWEGNAWYSGDVYVGSTSGTNKDEGSKKLATEDFVREFMQSDEFKTLIRAEAEAIILGGAW